jgi:tRNA 2-thiouridine synthesizing protein A
MPGQGGWVSIHPALPQFPFLSIIAVVTTQHAYQILVRRVIIPELEYHAGICPPNRRQMMSETILDTGTIEIQKDLDARGLNCPLPILKAKKALAELASGEVLRIVATDTGSVRDFQAFAKQTGNALLAHTQINGEFTFWLRRK